MCSLGRSFTRAIIFVRENPIAALRIYWSVNPAAKDAGDPAAAEASGLREIEYILKGYQEYKNGQKGSAASTSRVCNVMCRCTRTRAC